MLSQCSQGNSTKELLVSLNKEETLRFADDRKAYVQLQAKPKEGSGFASKKTMITVYPVYDDSVLDDDIIPTPIPDSDGLVILDGSTIV